MKPKRSTVMFLAQGISALINGAELLLAVYLYKCGWSYIPMILLSSSLSGIVGFGVLTGLSGWDSLQKNAVE